MDEIVELSTSEDHPLWTDGIICAFEFIQGTNNLDHLKQKQKLPGHNSSSPSSSSPASSLDSEEPTRWVAIGWSRISELVKSVPPASSTIMANLETVPVTVLAPPFKEQPEGPTWWCHMRVDHPFVLQWLKNATMLHSSISLALIQSKPFSVMSKCLPYEVPVRVAGGLLFELWTSAFDGDYDPFTDEWEHKSVTFRCWQAQNFLLTVVHSNKNVPNNVPGISDFKEFLNLGGDNLPNTIHELIAHLVCFLSRWDFRIYNNFVFGKVEQFEFDFRRRSQLYGTDSGQYQFIFDIKIESATSQLVRVKFQLDQRDDIFSELLHHLRGSIPQKLLEVLIVRTRDLSGKQLVFRERLFLLQDTTHNNLRALIQGKSLRITHNFAVVGGCGLFLSLIIGLMGVNLDGMPFVKNASYGFWSFFGLLVVLAIAMALVCRKYCALKLGSKNESEKLYGKEIFREACRAREKSDNVKMHFDNNQQEIRSKEEAEEMGKKKAGEMEKKKATWEEWDDVEKVLAL